MPAIADGAPPAGGGLATDEDRGPLRVELLGGLRVRRREAPVALPAGCHRLVALLAVSGRLHRSFVAASLWPEATVGRAAGALRSALWRLRAADPELVRSGEGTLDLGAAVEVDFPLARAVGEEVIGGGRTVTAHAALCRLGAGELLPGWPERWVAVERERFHELRVHALEALAEELAASGDLDLGIAAALAAVDAEPLRESARRALIGAYLAVGHTTEAVRQYHGYGALLLEELGASPSEELRALVFPSDAAAG